MNRALIVCVFLTGCASMTENQCHVDSWYARGEQDGLMGWQPKLDLYASQCGRYQVQPAERDYMAGWAAGASEYNTRVGGSKM